MIGRKEKKQAGNPIGKAFATLTCVMTSLLVPPSDLTLFTPRDIAKAAGVPIGEVLAALGDGRRDQWVPRAEAVRVVRRIRTALERDESHAPLPDLFARPARSARVAGLPAAASGAAHALIVALALFVAGVGVGTEADPATTASERLEPVRLVFLAIPGPGGGGGGGGLRQKAPAPKAERQGRAHMSSPVPERRPAPVEAPSVAPPDPPPQVLAAEQLPPLIAPVVPVAADQRTRIGVLESSQAEEDSHGPGTGGGTGSGTGTGVGQGDGSGIGPGSGGGTGGGPYRPGSGIEPPTILREVKPFYTEQARQRGVTGEVVLEIVVQRDGSVGAVRVRQGLGSGLDERAIEAVRQWRFAPARRLGQPVDVMVEVAVEFRLR